MMAEIIKIFLPKKSELDFANIIYEIADCINQKHLIVL